MAEGRGVTESQRAHYHARFQNLVAIVFFVCAVVVAAWIFWGPRAEGTVTRLAILAFVQLPLFVIFALIGMNALVRKGMGPKSTRAKRR